MLVKAEGARFPLDHYLLTAVDRSSGYKMVHPFEVLPCKLNPDTCPSLTAFSYPPPPSPPLLHIFLGQIPWLFQFKDVVQTYSWL